VCDNCSRMSREKKPRDFRLSDLHATMVRHVDRNAVNQYVFNQYCLYHDQHKELKEETEVYKYTRKRMHEYGYTASQVKACENMYKKGMEVIKLLKERGIQHHPRKKKNV
jgi:hypothetical protein